MLDSGVDYNHPDLWDNIYVNAGEVPGNGVDDDDNGWMGIMVFCCFAGIFFFCFVVINLLFVRGDVQCCSAFCSNRL